MPASSGTVSNNTVISRSDLEESILNRYSTQRYFVGFAAATLSLRMLSAQFPDLGQITLHLAPAIPERAIRTAVECSLERPHTVLEERSFSSVVLGDAPKGKVSLLTRNQ